VAEEDIWEGDLLGRKEEGKYLQRYIENLYKLDKKDQTSFVLNINSEWGHGKTWFLKRFSRQLEVNFPVVYFDAWKNDFTKDPLMSFVSVVCEELANRFTGDREAIQQVIAIKDAAIKFIKPSVPVILAALVKHYTGLSFEQLGGTKKDQKKLEDISDVISEITKIASSEAMNIFVKEKTAIEEFTTTLEALVNKISSGASKTKLHLPICIIIDELDRCRPTYAIELLETVKHLFSVKGIFFILATDTVQLSHSIKAIYGQGFSADVYLKRFFYAEYVLSTPDYYQVAKFLFDQASGIKNYLYLPESFSGDQGMENFFAHISKFFKLSVRDQEQVFKVLESTVVNTNGKSLHFLFLIFLICLKQKYNEEFKVISVSKSVYDLGKFLSRADLAVRFENFLLIGRMRTRSREYDSGFYITDIFQYYCNVLDLGGALKNSKILREEGWSWQIDISNKLFQEFSIEDGVGVHDLATYFRLLDQSGRLVANP
jgi:KAP family P-loop domain